MTRRLNRATRLLLSAVLVTSCGGSHPSPNPAAPSVAQWLLKGTVTEKLTGAAVDGARIDVLDGPNAGAYATTDAAGAYRLAALTQAGFTVKVSKAGFTTQTQPVTLTMETTLDVRLSQAAPNVKVVFEPATIPVTNSGDREYPRQLLFTLYVQEANFVDVTVQAVEFSLLMTDGRTARWSADTADLLESYPSLLVRGGTWKGFRWNLIYDGLSEGTLTAVVVTTDAAGEHYRATGTAALGPVATETASSFSTAGAHIPPRMPSTLR